MEPQRARCKNQALLGTKGLIKEMRVEPDEVGSSGAAGPTAGMRVLRILLSQSALCASAAQLSDGHDVSVEKAPFICSQTRCVRPRVAEVNERRLPLLELLRFRGSGVHDLSEKLRQPS
jgi:hypothetical protein